MIQLDRLRCLKSDRVFMDEGSLHYGKLVGDRWNITTVLARCRHGVWTTSIISSMYDADCFEYVEPFCANEVSLLCVKSGDSVVEGEVYRGFMIDVCYQTGVNEVRPSWLICGIKDGRCVYDLDYFLPPEEYRNDLIKRIFE